MPAKGQVIPVHQRLASHYTIDIASGCWNWTGARSSQGQYPGFTDSHGEFIYAHRISYELSNGPIGEGLEIHHICNNHRCVNPRHLTPVTPSEHRRLHHQQRTAQHRSRMPWVESLILDGFDERRVKAITGVPLFMIRDSSRRIIRAAAPVALPVAS